MYSMSREKARQKSRDEATAGRDTKNCFTTHTSMTRVRHAYLTSHR